MGKHAISTAAFAFAVGILIGPGLAQEVKQESKPTSNQAKVAPVTQDQLNAADKSASNFLLTNGNYAQTPPSATDQPRQCQEIACCLDLPDRRRNRSRHLRS
jgi:hypothetical protein